jgi:hypothetical protein
MPSVHVLASAQKKFEKLLGQAREHLTILGMHRDRITQWQKHYADRIGGVGREAALHI